MAGQNADIKPVWASEIEPYPIRVTHKRFPDMQHLGNAEKINGAAIEPVDIITFGSSCQDMAMCGNRSGIYGPKSKVFFDCTRIIKEMRDATHGASPTWIIWENVYGAFSSNKGGDFHTIIKEICSIGDRTGQLRIPRLAKWPKCGTILADTFDIAWRTLDAKLWGVPQSRRRIFLVGCFRNSGGGGYPKQIFRDTI